MNGLVGRLASTVKQKCRQLLTMPSLVWIDVTHCTSRMGHNFFDVGWHPYTSLLDELTEDNPTDRDIESSEFFAFYTDLRISSQFWSRLHRSHSDTTPYWQMPWGSLTKECWNDPTPEVIIANARGLFRLRKGIRDSGYRPHAFFPDYPFGLMLYPASDSPRYVIFSGNHRMAVCRHLNINKVLGQIGAEPYIPYQGLTHVWESRLMAWPNVANGMFTPSQARRWLEFYLTGWQKEDLLLT